MSYARAIESIIIEVLEDRGIDRISISGMLSGSEEFQSNIWRLQHRTAYRKFSKEWSLTGPPSSAQDAGVC